MNTHKMDGLTRNSVLDAMQATQSNVAAFPADSLSAIKSRQFVRTHLSKAAVPETVIEAVELVTSELATNAVLHASTGPTVTISVTRGLVRLEVRDASTATPVLSDYGCDAATGRGLSVVSRTATAWGIDTDQFGKTVWAEFDIDATSPDFDEDQQPHMTSEVIVDTRVDATTKTVELINVPVDLYFLLEQHNDAALREFELLAIQMQEATPDIMLINHRLAELVVASTRYFNTPKSRMRLAVQRARHRGLETVNLKGVMDAEGLEFALDFGELMNEADALCDAGVLLTAPSPKEVRELRRWMKEEIEAQYSRNREPQPFMP